MSNGRPPKEQDALRRTFGDLPVEEAVEPLIVYPDGRDFRSAQRGDAEKCALAKACRRLYGSSAAVVMRGIAYVDVADEDGRRVVRRYELSRATRNAIVNFDIDGTLPSGGFRFKPPTKSRRLDEMRKANKRQRDARIAGRVVEPTGKKTRRAEDVLAIEGLRNGSGTVHFSQDK